MAETTRLVVCVCCVFVFVVCLCCVCLCVMCTCANAAASRGVECPCSIVFFKTSSSVVGATQFGFKTHHTRDHHHIYIYTTYYISIYISHTVCVVPSVLKHAFVAS